MTHPFSPEEATVSRRGLLRRLAAGLAVAFPGSALLSSCRAPGKPTGTEPIIEREILWNGRCSGPSWFHPRPCVVPGPTGSRILMTLQSISGSDFYGPVHWTRTDDLGRSWADPEPITSLGRRKTEDGYEEGVCDVVPQFHPPTGRVLAVGHNVWYRNGRLTRPSEGRFPVYVTADPDGGWSPRHRLDWDGLDTTGIYTCGCGERLALEDGDVLIPVSFAPVGRKDRGVTTLLCAFDGERLAVRQSGNVLRLPVKRGLLEPSITFFDGLFRMTLRAEDGHGYSAVSGDGLRWTHLRPWCWRNGAPLTMSTTQQHWLLSGGDLHLVYTRKDARNGKVMRYRAPLYMATVAPEDMSLWLESERVVLPLRGDPAGAPEHVARMGNFHTLTVNPSESWVTVGEARPTRGWKGDVLLARIRRS